MSFGCQWLRRVFGRRREGGDGSSGLRRGEAFAVVVRDGRIQAVHGEAPDAFVRDIERMSGLWGIDTGRIAGRRREGRIRIEVGDGVPAEHARAFQNAWDHPL